jgi:hypothetical protein
MKTIVALLATSAILSVHADQNAASEKEAEITKGVFITLTGTPCTMYEAPEGVFLYKAHAVDKTIDHKAVGCYSKEDNGTVVINLVNETNGNQYGYVLDQAIFKDKYIEE